jgi:hypothetical protein
MVILVVFINTLTAVLTFLSLYARADTALYRDADCRQRIAVCIQNEWTVLSGGGIVTGWWLSLLGRTVAVPNGFLGNTFVTFSSSHILILSRTGVVFF